MENQFYDSSGFARALNKAGIRATGGSITVAIKKGLIDAYPIGDKWIIEAYELERIINTADFLNNSRISSVKLKLETGRA